jgi:adhesin transport system membrane fusion protein
MWVHILALCVLLVWASVFRVDQTTRGTGSVISSSHVQVIQAVDGGVIKSLKVREGDIVNQGQVLALLDQTRSGASVKELDARLASLKAQAARLQTEIIGTEKITFPSNVLVFPELVKVQEALFNQKRQSFKEEMETLEAAVSLAREDAEIVAQLASSGDVSRSEVIRSKRVLNDAQAQLVNRKNKYYQDVRAELAKTEDDINQNEQVRTQRNQIVNDSVIKTPVSGIVKNVRITTLGGVLRSGDELMQIVPLDDKLIIEIEVNPSNIANVHSGLPAAIRFDAFDYTVFGAVDGKVVYISADTIKEDTKTGVQTYYRVHVEIVAHPVVTRTGKTLDIMPGMTARVDIRTGDRTVLEYMLKPLRKTLTESMGER